GRRPRQPARAARARARAGKRRTLTSLVLAAAGAGEVILLVAEQHVEGGQGAVAAGDVLLQVDLFLVAELGVAVDLLLEHAHAIAQQDDLVEEDVDGALPGAARRIARPDLDLAAGPTVAQLHRLVIGERRRELIFDGVADDAIDLFQVGEV